METSTLVFTNEELLIIFEALSELPYKKVVSIIGTIQNQLQAVFAEKQRQQEPEKGEKEEKGEKGDNE